MERENHSLPIEEPERNSDQGVPFSEAHHELNNRATRSEAQLWYHLKQHLARLGVTIALHVVLEPDMEGEVHFKRREKWVVVEQVQGKSAEPTDGDEGWFCDE